MAYLNHLIFTIHVNLNMQHISRSAAIIQYEYSITLLSQIQSSVLLALS